MNRVEELKDKYKDNAEIFNILTDNKNIVVKQEGGVQTVIISKDAAALEQRLKVQF
jgi:tricorn protease-like protein